MPTTQACAQGVHDVCQEDFGGKGVGVLTGGSFTCACDCHTDTYPEHEKLTLVADKSQAIGEFVDWLGEEHGIMLASYPPCINDEHPDCQELDECRPSIYLYGVNRPIRDFLAQFFGIDQDVLEREKRRMLEVQRKLNELHQARTQQGGTAS